jgi:hypothetical protein
MNTSTVALAARLQVRDAARWLPWLTAIVALVYTGIGIGIATVGTLEDSVWTMVGWNLLWIPFVAGIGTGTYLPALVAHGISRRSAVTGTIAGMVGLAVVMAAYVQLGFAVEWLAYRATGRPYTLEGQHLFTQPGQVHLVLAEYTLLFAGCVASGWLVWASYYRYGAPATAALPLALLPGIGTLAALAGGWNSAFDAPVALALALAAVAAGVAAMATLGRAIPISTS